MNENPRALIVANTKVVSVLSGPEADFWPAGASGHPQSLLASHTPLAGKLDNFQIIAIKQWNMQPASGGI